MVVPHAPALDPRVHLSEIVASAFAEASQGGGLGGTVAAGLLLRFGEPSSLDLVRAEVDPVGDVLDAWWADVGSKERDGACRLAAARCERLHVVLDDLDDELDPGDPDWWDALESLLRERDELASVQCVLEQFSVPVYPLLEAMDVRMVTWLRSLPVHVEVRDPLLREVAERGEGWWAGPPHRED